MKNADKYIPLFVAVVGGVIFAGYAMNKLGGTDGVLASARQGYRA